MYSHPTNITINISGEWKKKEAGGPVHTIRDRAVVASESAISRMNAIKHVSEIIVIIRLIL